MADEKQILDLLPEKCPARLLTARKTATIIDRQGYNLTGFVLTNANGDIGIVDKSAVRWISKDDFWALMHK